MDLHDFDVNDLYFESPPEPRVLALLEQAAEAYGDGEAEPYLQEAHALAPDNLMVHVALYRFYYYQHRYADALSVAECAIAISGRLFGYRGHWRQMTLEILAHGMVQSFSMVRFYLLALKGAGYLLLRMGEIEAGVERLEKVQQLDTADRLNVTMLLEVAYNHMGIYTLKQRMTA
ncbi:hypothetical protein GCM10011352_23900 [Marinobacterium zhoushanense]|uniref:Tetratricopeptide repeat protein n=1 Tax=Marinobacterium zhoushanense TaxID=1679163 RepID=A0ABQ1KGQ5_9GAMM|nr:hypothetical protein [Marinobacterium zhoushanense]GGB96976.1 hypothetical protein GCM10011352_23900 [Marinobacterium zhoushanense]